MSVVICFTLRCVLVLCSCFCCWFSIIYSIYKQKYILNGTCVRRRVYVSVCIIYIYNLIKMISLHRSAKHTQHTQNKSRHNLWTSTENAHIDTHIRHRHNAISFESSNETDCKQRKQQNDDIELLLLFFSFFLSFTFHFLLCSCSMIRFGSVVRYVRDGCALRLWKCNYCWFLSLCVCDCDGMPLEVQVLV